MPHYLTESEKKEIKGRFEANVLDGDPVEDCGKAMLSAESAFEYLIEEIENTLERRVKEIETAQVYEIETAGGKQDFLLKEEVVYLLQGKELTEEQ